MQRIDELVDKLGRAKFITTFDLTKGYWQVPIAEEDKPKTAFATHFGLFQFNVMPHNRHTQQVRQKNDAWCNVKKTIH